MAAQEKAGKEKMPKKEAALPLKAGKDTESVSTGSYDPHEYREVEHPTNFWETLVHVLKGSLGTGILAMPQAFSHSGYAVGLVGTVLIGTLCTYCFHVLIKSQYVLCKRIKAPILTYKDSMSEALKIGPRCLRNFHVCAGVIVDVFLITYQLGICCVYHIFVASNVKLLCDHYFHSLPLVLHMAILLVPLMLINSIRNLKLLAPFSTVANILTFAGFSFILVYIFDDLKPWHELEAFGTPRKYPLFLGTTLFALEAVGVVISLENNMKHPKRFLAPCGVLNIGMAIIVFLYVGLGFLGYWRYGKVVRGSITLELPNDEWMAQMALGAFSIAIFISYGLQCYVPVDILWNRYFKPRLQESKKSIFYEYLLRYTTVLVVFALAASIPRLGLFISLFGALCLSALGLFFPALIQVCVLWDDQKFGRGKWILIKDCFLMAFGVLALIVGTLTAIYEIVLSFMEEQGGPNVKNVTTSGNVTKIG